MKEKIKFLFDNQEFYGKIVEDRGSEIVLLTDKGFFIIPKENIIKEN